MLAASEEAQPACSTSRLAPERSQINAHVGVASGWAPAGACAVLPSNQGIRVVGAITTWGVKDAHDVGSVAELTRIAREEVWAFDTQGCRNPDSLHFTDASLGGGVGFKELSEEGVSECGIVEEWLLGRHDPRVDSVVGAPDGLRERHPDFLDPTLGRHVHKTGPARAPAGSAHGAT
eukprot:CAMPEP_0181242994 /NCGR_PEP_ID=MMETSP1096-20121128/42005_1 /TAXON_ID=156174 ORGANISM="Chrysochromulina ericina, Strain CCMP281" /NCGR_SAMPLE_ID=MMETSP1096 /ASSEMBLY_ACC=CAM_ASM_000453 /LENGTH=176 /DNA_ID=CAMNT_0023339277 /DNA_START=210 /DNA_END=737 /DNA_ORIENTATION=-